MRTKYWLLDSVEPGWRAFEGGPTSDRARGGGVDDGGGFGWRRGLVVVLLATTGDYQAQNNCERQNSGPNLQE